MIKITALNEVESSEDSEMEVSKEALEQIALQQYASALDLHSRGNLADATQMYKDLLDTELLYNVKKPESAKTSSQLWYIKYLCYRNLGSLLSGSGNLDEAIVAYIAASELDDTDVSLWHRLGQVCMQAKHFEMALYAFQRGVECNPRHWPCLDHILTLSLALDYTEQCLVTAYHALQFDPSYLRGLVYRRHIYSVYNHMRQYMEYVNPMYKWKEDDIPIDETEAKLLVHEAEIIYNTYVEQQRSKIFVYKMPHVTLEKPISVLSWESVGDSLVHLHHYMTEHSLSHACLIVLQLKDPESLNALLDVKTMEDNEKHSESGKSTQITVTKNRKRHSNEPRVLKQWHWYTKTLSTRGKTASQKKYKVYDTLRNLCKELPFNLDINKMFQIVTPDINEEYFGSESEENDVKEFIKKNTENKKDIIDLLNNYLTILASHWKDKWSSGLAKMYIEAYACYRGHVDVPAFMSSNIQELLHYIRVSLLVEELVVKEKLNEKSFEHCLSVLDSIDTILSVNPHVFQCDEYPDLIQRALKQKILVYMLNGNKDLALEGLYQLYYESVDA